MKWYRVDGYARVQKRIAEKLYNQGGIIYLCPCNLRPGRPWNPEIAVCLTDGDGVTSAPIQFDDMVDRYAAYNCNREDGLYPLYFVKL